MTTDPLLDAIETVLIDGIEAEPGIRLRLGWPKLAAEILAAVEATGRLLPDPKARRHVRYVDDGVEYCGWYVAPGEILNGCGHLWPCPSAIEARP